MEKIKKVILILSGKGGVGKSTVASQLALTLTASGNRVGLLDVDICGPSLAKMLNVEHGEVIQTHDGWLPVKVRPDRELYLMSIAFLSGNKNSAVIWRGPKKHAMIKQFLNDVNWGELDYLIVDTPPGTSDEHISLIECIRQSREPDGAILVTTPQVVACNDVRREITFCNKGKIPILGLIENMSGYICPHCSECTNIFSVGGGMALSNLSNIRFLCAIPIDSNLCLCTEQGKSYVDEFEKSEISLRFKDVVSCLTET